MSLRGMEIRRCATLRAWRRQVRVRGLTGESLLTIMTGIGFALLFVAAVGFVALVLLPVQR
jgi:hypothetical protein